MLPVGDEAVVVMRLRIQGPASGALFEQEVAHVVRATGGKLDRQRAFGSKADALAAAE
jgi:hypothetical protein